ncbi:putative Gnk2-like domain-containing protein [Helianthus annuus]|nr:putative Gnk2-like domain-containing protein [Helianthus annuus]
MAFTLQYLIIFSLCILYVESTDPSAQLCNENSNTTTSEIKKNIDSLLTTLVQATSKSGYSATSLGSGQSRVYGLAQCRGDVPSDECSTCIQTAAKEIKKVCPDRVDARLWYEYCFIRYNTENFFGQVDTGYGTFYYNVENVTDPKTFNSALGALMYRINSLASAPGNKGIAKDETKLTDFVTLYALSLCTQDLSQLSCRQCLAIAVGNFPTYCDSKKGCRIIYSSCYVRYELYPFFFPLDAKSALESSSMTNYVSVIKKH